jgi:hypothetical protein
MELVRERLLRLGRYPVTGSTRKQRTHCHAVLCERAGFVDAQDGRRTQGLDGRHATRQNMMLRDAPGSQGQEDRQHDRKFFG